MEASFRKLFDDGPTSCLQVIESKDFEGTKTVSDLVGAGGTNYRLIGENCHDACDNIMNQ